MGSNQRSIEATALHAPVARRPARDGVRSRLLSVLALIGVLPLPILAYGLGAYVLSRGGGAPHDAHLLSPPALLLFGALLIASVGGFLIWRAVRSLARTEDVEQRLENLKGTIATRLEESNPVMTSFTRMLSTIERQTDELNTFARRLDTAHRELESTNARLQELSLTDEITQLCNRRAFLLRLEEEVGRYHRFGHPFSLVLLDIDAFKAVNDDLGHSAGDETLRGLADLLLKNSRGIDVICRFGGDEFAVLLVETGRAGAETYAGRVRDLVAGHGFAHGRRITVSAGVASIPEGAQMGHDIVHLADEALYAAKRAGKNRVAMSGDPAAGLAAPRGEAAA